MVTSDKEGDDCELEKHLPDTDILITTVRRFDVDSDRVQDLAEYSAVLLQVLHVFFKGKPAARKSADMTAHTGKTSAPLQVVAEARLQGVTGTDPAQQGAV